jgi:O-antigen/teichoic acid export membrane protein
MNSLINILKVKKFIKIFLSVSTAKIAVSSGVLILNIVIVKISNEKVLGVFMSAISLMIFFSVLSRAGIPNSLIRFSSVSLKKNSYKEFKQILIYSFRIVFILSLLVMIISIFLINNLYEYIYSNFDPIYKKVFIYILLSLPFISVLFLLRSIVKGIYRPALSAIFEYELIYFFIILIALFYFINGFIIEPIQLSNLFLIFSIIQFSILSIYLYFKLPKIFKSNINKIDDSNGKLLVNFKNTLFDFFQIDLINFALNWGGLLILGFLSTEYTVGQFSAIYWLAISIQILPVVINTITSPYYAGDFDKKNYVKIYSFMNNIIILLSLFILPFIAIIFFFSEYLLIFIYNSAISDLSNLFNLLIFSISLSVIFGNCGAILSMCGYQKHNKNIALIYGSILIITLLIFVPLFDLKGAVFAYSISIIIKSLLVYGKTKQILINIIN